MDNAEIRALLRAFRKDSPDRNDPIFREALRSLASEPELAAWFRAEQEFDAVMVQTFRDVPVHAAAKELILRSTKQVASGPGS